MSDRDDKSTVARMSDTALGDSSVLPWLKPAEDSPNSTSDSSTTPT